MTTLASTPDVTQRYDPVIGLETHVELGTASKMFCGCPTAFGAEPNTQTCPVCLGLPGSLPVANAAAIESTIRIGLALHCSIAEWCRFARKNYFYPDMPKNFQISQYDEPLCTDGWLDVPVERRDRPSRRSSGCTWRRTPARPCTSAVPPGGSTAPTTRWSTTTGPASRWWRSSPSRSPAPAGGAPVAARAYVTELRELLRTLGVSDVRMEQGSLRCDVNLSLSPRGSGVWGTRTETKNVNSLRSVERAVRFEMARQAGGPRLRRPGRAGDPALPRGDRRDHARAQQGGGDRLPVLPRAGPGAAGTGRRLGRIAAPRRCRSCRRRAGRGWPSELGATPFEMASMANAGALDLVASTVDAGAPAAEARNWWLGYLAQKANAAGVEAADLPITPAQVARVVSLVGDGTLSTGLARQAVDGVLETGADVDTVVAERGLRRVSDVDALAAAVDEAIAAQPDVAAKVRAGKVAAAGALVGAVMKATRGQADAKLVRELVLSRLTSSRD